MAGMATSAPLPQAPPNDSVWRAPLVPAALAYTAGVVLDRYTAVPFAAGLLLTLGGMLGWFVAQLRGRTRLPLAFLALAATAFGAAYHHYRRDVYPADDIGNVAEAEPRPAQCAAYSMRSRSTRRPCPTPFDPSKPGNRPPPFCGLRPFGAATTGPPRPAAFT